MIKNVIIAVLVGVVIGQVCKADTTINNGAITRKDLFAAAALCGLVANPYSPSEVRFQDKFAARASALANSYADKLIQDSPSTQ